jgi:hypothetical protein
MWFGVEAGEVVSSGVHFAGHPTRGRTMDRTIRGLFEMGMLYS